MTFVFINDDRDINNLYIYVSDNENHPKLNCHSIKLERFVIPINIIVVYRFFFAEILEFINALHLVSHPFPYHMYTQSRGYNSTKSQFLHILV